MINMNRIYSQLENITVGMTATINGLVVTRWSAEKYEVGTWGKESCGIDEAAEKVSHE